MSALTKMLIVLQLICSLILAVLLMFGVSKLDDYKKVADTANAAKIGLQASVTAQQMQSAAAQQAVATAQGAAKDAEMHSTQEAAAHQADNSKNEAMIADLNAKNAQLSDQNAALTTANSSAAASIAAKDQELANLRPEVSKKTQENAELSKAASEYKNQLNAAENAIKRLQEQLAQAQGPGGGGATMPGGNASGQVAQLSNGATSGTSVNAKISEVAQSAGKTLIQIPLGTRDGVQVNTRLFIYRDNKYLADAVIQRVTPDQSVAAVVNAAGIAVQAGDMVSTLGQ